MTVFAVIQPLQSVQFSFHKTELNTKNQVCYFWKLLAQWERQACMRECKKIHKVCQ